MNQIIIEYTCTRNRLYEYYLSLRYPSQGFGISRIATHPPADTHLHGGVDTSMLNDNKRIIDKLIILCIFLIIGIIFDLILYLLDLR